MNATNDKDTILIDALELVEEAKRLLKAAPNTVQVKMWRIRANGLKIKTNYIPTASHTEGFIDKEFWHRS